MKDDTISRAAAIDALNRLEYTPGEWATNGLTMCKDAIKALPSATDTNVGGNLIDRQAAISEIMEDIEDRSLHDDPATPEDYAEGYDEGIRNAAAIVLQMPSAQPGWIPVTERLPKPNEYENDVRVYYLVQNEYGDMMVCSWHGSYWTRMYRSTKVKDKVVAWMPLPTPAKIEV